ncbi:MAG TPA: hypothetical protein VIG47_17220, partial [Gemmatimonadaceae bacterium]
QLSDSAGSGTCSMILLEFERGYGVVLRLSDQVLLFVSASLEVDLPGLLFDLRRNRSSMAALV